MKNLWTKFKNWLIGVLGGTTPDYTAYLIGEMPKARADYLALLNAYNALAEHWVNPMNNAKALKEHCGKYDNCIGCEFGTVCKVDGLPCNWELSDAE